MNCYIHIPFCNSKCKYCRFASLWKTQKFLEQKYLKFLLEEIKNFSERKEKLNTIYFWWWTPSTFIPSDLEKIIISLKNTFWLEKNIEITLETTPDNINLGNLISWEKIWINRISIWIQTLNNKSLEEVNRWDNKVIFDALDSIERYKVNWKINNFSFDFIIWLPYTKKWETKKDIEKILKKYDFITHISVYLLEDYYDINKEIEEKNNFEKITYPNSWEEKSLDEKDFLWEYLETKDFLKKQGFFYYEISNFSKKDSQCSHNKWYWNHTETIWFGLSASSLIKNSSWKIIRQTNSANFVEYYSAILEEKNILYKNDIFLEKVMFWLRTSGLTEEIYKKLDLEKINYFIDLGFLEINKKTLILKDKWVLVLDYIIRGII